MRKQLKEAYKSILRAKKSLDDVSENENMPVSIREKSIRISSALDIDLKELDKMKDC